MCVVVVLVLFSFLHIFDNGVIGDIVLTMFAIRYSSLCQSDMRRYYLTISTACVSCAALLYLISDLVKLPSFVSVSH